MCLSTPPSLKPVFCCEGELVLKQRSWWSSGHCSALGAGGLTKLHVFENLSDQHLPCKREESSSCTPCFQVNLLSLGRSPGASLDYPLLFFPCGFLNVGYFSHSFLHLWLK